MPPAVIPGHPCDLMTRVRREFVEMPGVRLSLAQAARLWSVDRARARRVLDALVSEGFLCRDGHLYIRRGVCQRCA